MRLLLTKLEIIVLTIITILPILSPLCLLLLVRPVNLPVIASTSLTKLEKITMTIITILPIQSPLCLILLVRPTNRKSWKRGHPSHSQTSRLSNLSLSLGVPVPHGTQSRYVRRVDPSTLTFSLSSHRHLYQSLLFVLVLSLNNKQTTLIINIKTVFPKHGILFTSQVKSGKHPRQG